MGASTIWETKRGKKEEKMAARFVPFKGLARMRWVIMAVFWVATTLWIKAGYVAAQRQQRQPAPPQVTTPLRTAVDSTKTPSERQSLVINVTPVRTISDPNPVFRAVAVDGEHGEVFMANDKESAGTSILVYNTDFQPTNRIMEPKRRIAGPNSQVGMVCGLTLSPQHGELYAVSGETGTVNVYPLDANGNTGPARRLNGIIPRAGAGVYLDAQNDELFITTQHVNRISVYPRNFEENQEPLRYIQGPDTGLADPHGIFVDSTTNEIFVSNHGNYHAVVPGEGERRGPDSLNRTALGYGEPGRVYPLAPSTGKFLLPAISVHSRTASGDAPPIRMIQGPHTQLSLPDGIFRDPDSGEIIVANTGGDSILFFPKDANGDVVPDRVLKGPATKIKGPAGVSIDPTRHELWVASWDNHVAGVFPLNANGNMAPLRVIRTSTDDAPQASMGRIGQVAYDPKRKEILAPN
jgi:DNA-binding beta-propeller fold protein YncE